MRSTGSRRDGSTSSARTMKRLSRFGPNVVLNATSGVAPASHHDATDTGNVVPSIERVPAAAKIDLKPSAEIHRLGLGRDADVAEIPGAIARRNVHATAQRDRQMGKVAAYAATLEQDLGGGPGGTSVLVAEVDVGMNEIADRLHTRPTRLRRAEARPRLPHQTLGLAVSAAKQEHQRVVRQFCDFVLPRRQFDRIGQTRICDQGIRGNCELAHRRHQPRAHVAERIQVSREGQRGPGAKLIGLDDVGRTRRMHVEHQHHRRARDELVDDLEADTNLHRYFPSLRAKPPQIYCVTERCQGRLGYRNMGLMTSHFESARNKTLQLLRGANYRTQCPLFGICYFPSVPFWIATDAILSCTGICMPRKKARGPAISGAVFARAAHTLLPALQCQKSRPSSRMKRASTILCTSEAPSTRRAWRA